MMLLHKPFLLKQMGIYLSTPKTEKFSEDGENSRLRYGLSSMQGWRSTMEDAHAAIPDLDASTSFFGVYDGHGGNFICLFYIFVFACVWV
ncbi:probable protein phosphatase 2C 60 isoform X2 [Olea europaea var. sylvestris]|uniref:probable protein phosphatase 2C 60 isoform X2 n=1 Tax=Olea europaea var. sylvestris TaxID=158386 RepID=UPI000C1D3AB5|nr:probable protein phosphatase 2C 60 isoform X2 [Olea europaea var. sylvestris]